MTYRNFITLNDALYFNLFDEIPYRQVKSLLEPNEDRDEADFEVEIDNLPYDRPAYGKVRFSFTLTVDINVNGSLSIMRNKSFEKIIEYNTSSCYALKLLDLQIEEEDENEDDEEEEEEDEDEDEDEDDEEEEEEVRVRRFTLNDKQYLINPVDNLLYDTETKSVVGFYNKETNEIEEEARKYLRKRKFL